MVPRPGTPRLIASNAEGIRVSYALANNTLTNNVARRTGDDGLAVAAEWMAAVTQVAGASVTVSRRVGAPFPVGAGLSFVNPTDAAVLASANITAENPAFAAQTFADGELVTLTLDKAIAGLAAGFGVIDSDSAKRGSGSVMAGNTVQEVLNGRGLWLGGVQGVQVHDNFVQRTNNAGILIQELGGDTGPSSGVTIKNNLVDSAIGYGAVSGGAVLAAAAIHVVAESAAGGQVTTSPHSVILVTGNRVTNSARTGIRLENVNGGQITGKAIEGFGLNPALNVYALPPCCESMAQYVADFSKDVLTNASLLTVSGNIAVDASGLLSTVSTASYLPRVATGSFAVAFGAKIVPQTVVASQPFPTTLGGVTVQVMDSAGVSRNAQIYYVAPTAVSYLVPDGTAAGIATVSVGSFSGAAQIDALAPGVYTANSSGTGVAAALAAVYGAGGTVVPENVFTCAGGGPCVSSPLDGGGPSDALIVSLYGSGMKNASSIKGASATIGGAVAQVQYIGPVSGVPGLDQVNPIVPKSLAGAGEVAVVLTVDGQTANAVTINVR